MASAWLDRISHTSTPSSRRGSPAPRKLTSTPSRPSLDSRTNSLSTLTRSNSSTTSLTGTNTTRTTATSGLRRELSRPEDVEDPLHVLERVLGRPTIRGESEDDQTVLIQRPAELEDDLDFEELSLTQYAKTIDSVKIPSEVTIRSIQTAEEYDKERNGFEDLHKTIARCDEVLNSVEMSLASFQKDLGLVSAEIETLQDRSTTLTTRLENRKVVEKMLGPAAEDVSISPDVVRTLSERPIDDDWLKALSDFEKRGKAIEMKLQEDTPMKAAQDVKPILENLRNKVNERIRDHIVTQIKAVRSPNINAQVIQQNNLIKYRDIFSFLSRYQNKLAGNILQAYVNTMRWYYTDNFQRYRQALEKLKVVPIGKEDTIGSDPSISRGARPGAASALFDLGRRAEVLSPAHPHALSSYLASEDKSAHHIEIPFRNFLLALVDNVSAEYHFVTTFFATTSYGVLSRRCNEIFAPTLALCRDLTQSLLDVSTLDCLGILLCIRITQQFAFELQRRKVPVVDDHVNGLLILLWPAFQKAMDAHTESIKTLATSISSRTAASKLTFGVTGTSGTSDALSKASTAPHFLTQRFGQFLYGILTISQTSGDDEPVASSLARMRSEFEKFVTKAAKNVGGTDKSKRERFLENQLMLIETITSDTEGKLAGEVARWIKDFRSRENPT